MTVRSLSLILVALAAGALSAAEPKSEWVRQTVLLRSDDVKPGKLVGKELVRGDKPLDANDTYVVRAESGDHLELLGGRGWVAKTDAILVKQAADFFNDKLKAEPGAIKWIGRRGVARLTGFEFALGAEIRGPKSAAHPAFADLSEAARLDPKCVRWRTALGVLHVQHGEWERAEAEFDAAVRLAPQVAEVYHFRAGLWMARKDADKMVADLNAAIKLDPNVAAYYNLRGVAALVRGQLQTARGDFDQALVLDPEDARALGNRAVVLCAAQEFDRALVDLEQAIKLDPTDPTAVTSRSNIWRYKKEFGKILAEAERVAALQPTDPDPLRRVAWVLATIPDEAVRDGKRAVEVANKALKLADKNPTPPLYGTLAAAYAETGDFDRAVANQQKVLDMLNSTHPTDEPTRLRQEMILLCYKRKDPYRD